MVKSPRRGSGRQALLIGSPVHPLEGPARDAGRVADMLQSMGFDTRCVVDQDATREGILHAYRSLIENAAAGDAAVVYYSGHGARFLDAEYEPREPHDPTKRHHRFIVPVDLAESSEGDFRGILSLELSSLLAQLTNKTTNVTVVFDCCHSGGMTRDLRMRLKAVTKEWHVGAHDHYVRLARGEVSGFPASLLPKQDNDHAVRLMAALPSQQAWEYEDAEGPYGLMTHALLGAFEEAAGRPVNWSAVARRVREIVRRTEPGQYPDVEGPADRFVFQLEEARLTDVVTIRSHKDGPRLDAGALLGTEVGDQYVVMPPGFQKIDREKALGLAEVTWVGGSFSFVRVEPAEVGSSLPDGAQAFPASRAYHKRPVVVKAAGALRAALEASLGESGLLRLPTEGEEGSSDVLAVLEEREGQVHVREKSDLDLIRPIPTTDPVLAKTITRKLDRLARARKLEMLASGSGGNALRAEYELDWGRVVGGAPQPLPETGAMLFVGDRIYVRVRNRSRSTLYVNVLDIGLAGRVELLTREVGPSGFEVEPDGPEFILGFREPVGWTGLGPLSWPDEVPKDGLPRPESLVVIITDRPQDLRALVSPEEAAPKGERARRSELERLADQFATGRTRDVGAETVPPDVRYAVRHISAMVDPSDASVHLSVAPVPDGDPQDRRERGALRGGPAASPAVEVPAAAVADESTFLIDERPDSSAVFRRAKGTVPPSAVAIQLGELVVHGNRALFSTSIRVDALVVTGAGTAEEAYAAGTRRFDRIKDGDRLPFDDMIVYHGPARGFLDVAVWVSREDQEGLDLVELLRREVNGTEFKDAALVLAGLVIAAPTAGAVIAGMGAATTLANIAYKLLRKAAGKTIGLYRTSLLANDRFGIGRHPASGLMRAQDFSFCYKVTEV